MNKFATDIERDMAFRLTPSDIRKKLGKDDAISSLSKARDILDNIGFKSHSSMISEIIKRAKSVDDSDIEVTI